MTKNDDKRNDPANRYDAHGIVQREMVMQAGGLKFAVYRVRDPETGEYSYRQVHLTMDNTIMALMGESSAKLFAMLVNKHVGADQDDQIGQLQSALTKRHNDCMAAQERVKLLEATLRQAYEWIDDCGAQAGCQAIIDTIDTALAPAVSK